MELFSFSTCFSRFLTCLNSSLGVGDGFEHSAAHSESYSSSCSSWFDRVLFAWSSLFVEVSDCDWLGVLGSPFPVGIPPWIGVAVALAVGYLL